MAVLRLGSVGLGLNVLEVLDLGTVMKCRGHCRCAIEVLQGLCIFTTIITTSVIAIIFIAINSAGSCRGDRLLRVPSS